MPIQPSLQLGRLGRTIAWSAILCLTAALAGCERKERILDIEAPGVDIEVDKSRDGIEVRQEKPKKIDIEAPGIDLEIDRDRD